MAVRTFHTLTHPTWKRQPDETTTAYNRFTLYLEQPWKDPDYTRSEGRSLYRVATAARVSDRAVHELASKHRWEERARDFDQHRAATQHDQDRAANTQRRDRTTSTALAVQNDLLLYLRTSIQHLTSTGQYLQPSELPHVADAIATIGEITTPTPSPEEQPAARLHAVGVHIADILTTRTGPDTDTPSISPGGEAA